MYFNHQSIDLYLNNTKIESITQKGESYDVFTLKFPQKVVLYPGQIKTMKFQSPHFENKVTYCIHANHLSFSVVIPTIDKAENNTLNIILRNDSRKKVHIKRNTLLIDFEIVSDVDQIFNFHSPEMADLYSVKSIEDIPIPFFNKNCQYNSGFYSKTPDLKVKNLFLNGIISAFNSTTVHQDEQLNAKDNFESLSELPGYEVELEPLPWPEVNTIIEEGLPQSLKPELRQFLIELFSKYPEVVSRHNWDIGVLSNYKGDPVLLDIPLKSPLPLMQKSYALNKEDRAAINDIFDFLIFHGLAVNCTVDNQTGCPAFLVPRSDQNKSKRLIVDTRKTNTYISAPCGTTPTQVLHEIQNLMAEQKYCSSVDIVQAYYTLRLSKKSLDSNISNIYCGDRCVKLLVALTGTSYIPLYFTKKLNEIINMDDDGHFSPLDNRSTGFGSWFDDLYTVTSTIESHKIAISTLIHRIHRSKIKINLKKSYFFKDIHNDLINILGHEIKGGSIVPEENKLKILIDFPSPTDRKGLQSFLGHLNFLRNLLPLQIIHLSTVLTPLTSPNVPYEWSEKHEKAFLEMKSLLKTSVNYLDCPLKNPINIVYTDSSESLLGGILFQYVPSKSIVRKHAKLPPNIAFVFDPPHSDLSEEKTILKPLDYQAYQAHVLHYKLALGMACTQDMNNLPVFQVVVRIIIIATRWSQSSEWKDQIPTTEEVSEFLATIYCNLPEIQSKINRLNFKIIMDKISETEIDDEFFFSYTEEIFIILSIISAHNIKLIFGINRPLKSPGFSINEGYEHDILLGWCPSGKKFDLFYILEDWEDDNFPFYKLFTNKNLMFSQCSEETILSMFQESLKSASANKNIRIVAQFSKTISTLDMAKPIYIKEISSLLYGLEYFQRFINASKLTLLVSDSKIAFFLFNSNIHNSVKKIEKWSVKISISYPNIRLVHVTSRNQVADFLSRLGLSKSKFFARGLTPVSFNKELWEKVKVPYAKWEDIYKITQDFPDIINFSEKKLPYTIADKYYLDSILYEEHKESKSFNLITLRERFSILDSLINRQKIIEYQLKDLNPSKYTEQNGMLIFNGKIVLPPSLYAISLVREHFLNAHTAPDRLLEITNNLFHIENKKIFKEITMKLTKSCLACLLNNPFPNRYIRGMFHVSQRNQCIQMDFIEGLPEISYCLTIIDLYSSYISVYPCQNKTVNSIMVCLSSYISVHGNINTIIADNYPGFRSKKLQDFCKLHGIKLSESAPYISEGRSLVERCQRTYQFAVRAFKTHNNIPWINIIPLVVFLINNRPFLGFSDVTPHSLHFKSYLNTGNSFRLE